MIPIFLLIGFAFYNESKKSDKQDLIQAGLAEFNDAVPRYLSRKKFSEKPLPIVGKIILIDSKLKKAIPYEEYGISQKYRPASAEEVKTAIIQNCNYSKIGVYSNGANALQEECSVHVVDVETHTWSYWGTVKGSKPSDEIRRRRGSSSDEKGGKAMNEFLINNLS